MVPGQRRGAVWYQTPKSHPRCRDTGNFSTLPLPPHKGDLEVSLLLPAPSFAEGPLYFAGIPLNFWMQPPSPLRLLNCSGHCLRWRDQDLVQLTTSLHMFLLFLLIIERGGAPFKGDRWEQTSLLSAYSHSGNPPEFQDGGQAFPHQYAHAVPCTPTLPSFGVSLQLIPYFSLPQDQSCRPPPAVSPSEKLSSGDQRMRATTCGAPSQPCAHPPRQTMALCALVAKVGREMSATVMAISELK